MTTAPVPSPATPAAETPPPSTPKRRRWRRVLRNCGLALAALLILPWLWIKLFQPAPGPVVMPEIPAGITVPVYVMAHDHHTSIFIEQQPSWRLGPVGNEDARVVEIGWGHKTWYMLGRRGALRGISAAFFPSDSTVYVAGYPAPPHEQFMATEVFVREFQGDELKALVKTLEESIVRQENGTRTEPFEAVPNYPAGRFYPSREYYIFWHSCNHWTVEQLRKSGQDVSERGVFTSGQALERLKGWKRLR